MAAPSPLHPPLWTCYFTASAKVDGDSDQGYARKRMLAKKIVTVKMLGCLVCSSRGPSQVLGCGPGCQRCTALLTVAKITIATRGAALSGQPYDEVGTLGTSAYNTPILDACGMGDVLFLLLQILLSCVCKLACCCCCCYRYGRHHQALQWRRLEHDDRDNREHC